MKSRDKIKEKCCLCGSGDLYSLYSGSMRSGGVGSSLVEGYQVTGCKTCSVGFLNPFPERTKDFYETDEYRREYDNTIDEDSLTRKYESEQNDRIHKIGLENLRGKSVADFGAGLGLFLDIIKNTAADTLAIEPMQSFGKILARKGHEHYKYPEDIAPDSLDVGVCFDVLEHIEDPLRFLSSVNRSLKKEGHFYIAVPNRNDILMHAYRQVVQEFLYCTAHLFYFDKDSLSYALEQSGFKVIEKSGLHKYDFFNLISWLKEKKPCGRSNLSYLDPFFEANYKNELIRLGLSSHVFIKSIKV